MSRQLICREKGSVTPFSPSVISPEKKKKGNSDGITARMQTSMPLVAAVRAKRLSNINTKMPIMPTSSLIFCLTPITSQHCMKHKDIQCTKE